MGRANEGQSDIVLDLSGMRRLDASGIEAILHAHLRLIFERRRLVLASVLPPIRQALDRFALDCVIPMFSTVDAARETLRRRTKPR